MKLTCLKNNKLLLFIIVLLISYIVIDKGFIGINKTSPVEGIDTIKTYNTIIIDSIVYDIQHRDSIIYNIRYKYEEEIIKANSISDSAALELFKSLCSDDSLYGVSYTS